MSQNDSTNGSDDSARDDKGSTDGNADGAELDPSRETSPAPEPEDDEEVSVEQLGALFGLLLHEAVPLLHKAMDLELKRIEAARLEVMEDNETERADIEAESKRTREIHVTARVALVGGLVSFLAVVALFGYFDALDKAADAALVAVAIIGASMGAYQLGRRKGDE